MSETVVLTGAAAGVGRATARAFGRSGANIVLVARHRESLEAAQREIEQAGGHALVFPADVADADALDAAAEAAEREFGAIDIWVNCAMATIFSRLPRSRPTNIAAPPRSPISAACTARWRPCGGCAAQPRHHRAGRLGAGLSRDPAAIGVLRR